MPPEIEKNSNHAHKEMSWYLKRALLKIFDEHHRLIYIGVPPGLSLPRFLKKIVNLCADFYLIATMQLVFFNKQEYSRCAEKPYEKF